MLMFVICLFIDRLEVKTSNPSFDIASGDQTGDLICLLNPSHACFFQCGIELPQSSVNLVRIGVDEDNQFRRGAIRTQAVTADFYRKLFQYPL